MKKALIVTTIQSTIEAFLVPHIKFLEQNGYEVVIATNIFKEISKDLKNNRYFNLPFSRNPLSKQNFKAMVVLKKIMRDEKFDMIYVHTPIAAFISRYVAMKEKQKNVIYMAHGFHFFKGAPLINWLIYYPLEFVASKWTDKLITINQEDYEAAKKFKLKKNGKVYKVDGIGVDITKYSFGDREKIRKELSIAEDEKVLLMIGELNKNKNQVQLLNILENLKNKGKNVRGIFVGVGNQEKKLKDIVKTKGLKVDFLGYRKDIADIIASCDILCSMSYREGLPRNLMEGMCQGKPLLVTNIRGNRDIVVNGESGYIIELNEVEEASEKTITLLENNDIYNKMSKNAVDFVKKYSIEKVLKDMREVYEIEEDSYS